MLCVRWGQSLACIVLLMCTCWVAGCQQADSGSSGATYCCWHLPQGGLRALRSRVVCSRWGMRRCLCRAVSRAVNAVISAPTYCGGSAEFVAVGGFFFLRRRSPVHSRVWSRLCYVRQVLSSCVQSAWKGVGSRAATSSMTLHVRACVLCVFVVEAVCDLVPVCPFCLCAGPPGVSRPQGQESIFLCFTLIAFACLPGCPAVPGLWLQGCALCTGASIKLPACRLSCAVLCGAGLCAGEHAWGRVARGFWGPCVQDASVCMLVALECTVCMCVCACGQSGFPGVCVCVLRGGLSNGGAFRLVQLVVVCGMAKTQMP